MISGYNIIKTSEQKVDLFRNLNDCNSHRLETKRIVQLNHSNQNCKIGQFYNQTESIMMMSNGLTSIDHKIPTAEQTMRHQRFNKIAPFHTYTITRKGQLQMK